MNRCYRVITALLVLITWSSLAVGDPNNTEIQSGEKSGTIESSSPAPSTLADVPEVEPNNSLATAQLLGCGNVLRPASIATGAPPDTDYVAFVANAGDVITITTGPDGGTSVDTRIRLFNNSGVVLASDDDSGPGLYSAICSITAPYTGVYYVGIAAFTAGNGGVYRADVSCTPLEANDVCAGAVQIPCGLINLAGNTSCYTNNYTLPVGAASCTGFTAAGDDVVYRLDVSGGDDIAVIYTSTADASIYIVTDCANPAGTCVAGADATFGGQPEVLNYAFTASGTYYLILDSFGAGQTSGQWTLMGELRCGVVPTQKASWGQVKVTYR
jgi:uncharacterized protein YfaP (DUF2135 family)